MVMTPATARMGEMAAMVVTAATVQTEAITRHSLIHAATAARRMGGGSPRGPGGPGGVGGNASDGGDLVWIGPSNVIDSLTYSPVQSVPGNFGLGKLSGSSGHSGSGGQHGSRPGTCSGGDPGPTPTTPPTPSVRSSDGRTGNRGKVTVQVDNNIERMFGH
jgi:hypothetical protein